MNENNVAITRTNEPMDTEPQEEHAPVLRVWLFEGGRLEWHVAPIYQEEPWKGRAAARAIFFLLLCAPNRQALRGHLTGILWPEMEEENARSCLRSALKVLRQELRLPQGQAPLIEAIQNGEVLQLKGQEIIWVDADAFEAFVQQASQETDAQRALPLWQQARMLLKGEVLAEDRLREWITHRWIKARRQRVQVARRRLIRSLADLYVQRGEHLQAEELLQEHIITFPTDQDALYRLMKLLIKAECFVEAREAYERGKSALTGLGKHPAEPLKVLAERIPIVSFALQRDEMSSHVVEAVAPRIRMEDESRIESTFTKATHLQTIHQQRHSSYEEDSHDWSMWFGSKLAQLVTIVEHWQEQAIYCDHLQILLDQELLGFDTMKPQINDEAFIFSRRQALITIATLPVALWTSVQQERTSSTPMTEKFLIRCAASITSLWHLLKGSELSFIEQTLSAYIFTLSTLAHQPSSSQKTAARLTSQAYRLYGIVALHRNNLQAREKYCQQALYFSEIAGNVSLVVSAQISLASTFYYRKNPVKAAQIYQQALTQDEILPLQRSRLYAELAVVYAQQKREQEAIASLGLAQDLYPDHPEHDPSSLYAEFSPASMILEKGLTYLALAQYFPNCDYNQMAWNSFAHIENLQAENRVPERILFEITNRQAETALTLQSIELFSLYMEKGIEGAKKLASKQRLQELLEIYEQALVQWPKEMKVKEIENFLHEI